MQIQRMPITSVIKYDGNPDVVLYKHPCEDFNNGTTLIVQESQEAFFFNNGEVSGPYPAGRHVLQTQNIPFLRRIRMLTTGGENQFHCKVYYINKSCLNHIKWGLGNVIIHDPVNDYPFSMSACGEMELNLADAKRFLLKIGSTKDSVSKREFNDDLLPHFKNAIRANASKCVERNNWSVFEFDKHTEEWATNLRDAINLSFVKEYGVSIESLTIIEPFRPDNDKDADVIDKIGKEKGRRVVKIEELENERTIQLKEIETNLAIQQSRIAADEMLGIQQARAHQSVKLVELQAEKVARLLEAEIASNEAQILQNKMMIEKTGEFERGKLDVDLDAYRKELLAKNNRLLEITEKEKMVMEIMRTAAANPGSGVSAANPYVNLASGLATMAPIFSTVSTFTRDAMTDLGNTINGPKQGYTQASNPQEDLDLKENSTGDANKAVVSNDDFKSRVAKLDFLKDKGVLSEEEYKAEVQNLLDKYVR